MPTKAKIKKKPKKPTWVWVYGDEMPEVWEHFGFKNPDPYDRMKLKFVEYESETKQALLEEYDENG
jgi:hypothetical protein